MPYKNNEDRIQNARKYRRENPDKVKKWQETYKKKYPQRYIDSHKEYYTKRKSDPIRLERHTLTNRQNRFSKRLLALNLYGGCCACCGENLFEFLAFDHMDGGGKKNRAEMGSSLKFFNWLLAEKRENIQVLCHNCNMAKGFYGKCPHQAGALV